MKYFFVSLSLLVLPTVASAFGFTATCNYVGGSTYIFDSTKGPGGLMATIKSPSGEGGTFPAKFTGLSGRVPDTVKVAVIVDRSIAHYLLVPAILFEKTPKPPRANIFVEFVTGSSYKMIDCGIAYK
jgi:hypothetical protein